MEVPHPKDKPSPLTQLWHTLRMPLLALIAAFITGGIVMLLSGDNPFSAYWGLFQGAFGSLNALSRTIRKATPCGRVL